MRTSNAICEYCKTPFYSRPSAKAIGEGRFCKHKCYIAHKFGEKPKIKICPICGDSFDAKRRNKRFCSQSCAAKDSNRKRAGMKYDSVQNFKARLLLAFDAKCAICGYDKSVDGHHIKPQCKGGSDDISNGILLCPNHHREVHLDMITSQELVEIRDKMKGAS